MENLPNFILAGIALTGSPGPNTLGLAAASAAYGLRGTYALLAGAVVGVYAVILATAAGLTGLVLAQPGVAPVVGVLAAAYMLYLAYRIAAAPPAAKMADGSAPAPPAVQTADGNAPGFGFGLFLGLGNPKAYAAMAALYSGFTLVASDPVADAVAKTAVLAPMIVAVDVVWLLVGSALTRASQRPAVHRAINVGFAVLLVASVGLTFVL
jgi:threonine/homoserine/homoserine lactone efflux protein